MKISGVALGQWNQICNKKEGIRRTTYKIYRAIKLGKVSHVYKSNDYIVRYYDINILVSHTGLVMNVWRDKETQPYTISEKIKKAYDQNTTHTHNMIKANLKHKSIINKVIKKIYDTARQGVAVNEVESI